MSSSSHGPIDLLQRLVVNLREGVITLSNLISDDITRQAVLADLGLNPSSPVTLNLGAHGTNLDNYLAQSDPDLEAFLTVADDIIAILNILEGLVTAAGAGTQEVVDEAITDIFSLLAT